MPAALVSQSRSSWKKKANSSPSAANRIVRYSAVTSVTGTKYVEPGMFADHLLKGGVNGSSRGISERLSPSVIRIRS